MSRRRPPCGKLSEAVRNVVDGFDDGGARFRHLQAGGVEPEERLWFEAPSLEKYTDMQDLVLLDPVHEVDQTGWPRQQPDDEAALSAARQS